MNFKYPLATSSWDQREYDALQRVIASNKFSMGDEVAQFEKNFAIIPIFGIFDKISIQMNKNTSISLGNYFDQFVQSRISEGRFKNVSEVIRAGLRLLEEEESKVEEADPNEEFEYFQ